MYLSRIDLDLRHPSVRQALQDCNDMHRNLMQGFAAQQTEGAARSDGRVLYRVSENRNQIGLLLSSQAAPDRKALAARGFALSPDSPKDISALEQIFSEGMVLRFELFAAPCKKVAGEQKNNRRFFLRTEAERVEWLSRKAKQCGFDIVEMMEQSNLTPIEGNKRGMRIHYEAVRFVGLLRIVDRANFWSAYCEGIGPGKAYGLGMLTVARP